MPTTIQVSEPLVQKLKHVKEDLGVTTYEEVIERLIRQHETRVHSKFGTRPGLTWDKARDRMKFRTEE
jgi:predicted CopG family antitoxin